MSSNQTYDTSNKPFSWNINKADQSFTLNKTSVSLNDSTQSDTVTLTKNIITGGGNVEITNSNNSVASVSQAVNPSSANQHIITISSVNNTSGNATLTVGLSGNSNCNASSTQNITVSASFKTKVNVPTVTDTTQYYTGSAKSPTISSYDTTLINMTGTTSATENGSYTITFTLNDPINYIWNDGTSANKTVTWTINDYIVNGVKIVSWENGSDADIVAMVNAGKNGTIDLTDYWNLGEERQVTLNAISATSTITDVHESQTVTFVLMDQKTYNLHNAVTGTDGNARLKCSFMVGLKHCLSTVGCVHNSTSTGINWNNCARRAWLNSSFYNAIPSTLRGIFAQFENMTAKAYNNTSAAVVTYDYFVLPSVKEVFGSNNSYGNSYEDYFQKYLWYYESGPGASNKKKILGGNNAALPSSTGANWWMRSVTKSDGKRFVAVNTNGAQTYSTVTAGLGLAPLGCIY